MELRRIYILALSAVVLSGCQHDDGSLAADDGGVVTLSTRLGMPTRAAYLQTVPNQTNPLSAHLWASTTSESYPHDVDKDGSAEHGYEVGKHVEVTFYSGFAQVPKADMRFPFTLDGDAPEVYFVGMSPIGWIGIDDRNASFEFDGSQDVLFAPEVSGHYASAVPVLHFYHLLTHLRFIICCEGDTEAAREEVAYAWGRLKDIRLSAQSGASKPCDKVATNLVAGSSISAVASRTMFNNVSHDYLRLYKAGTTNTPFGDVPDTDAPLEPAWYDLPTASADGEEAAYVLCAPVMADAASGQSEYTLTLNTEKRSNVEVPIDLRTIGNALYSGSTIGCEFTVTLTFRFGKVIASSSAMHDWSQNGGQVIVDVKD